MIRIMKVNSSSITNPILVGDGGSMDDETEIEKAAVKYSIPIFERNGHKLCLIRNGKEQFLLDDGIIEATAAEEITFKARYGVE